MKKHRNLLSFVSGLLLILVEFYIQVWFGRGGQHQNHQNLNPEQVTFMFFLGFVPIVFGCIAVFFGLQGMIETAISSALQKETEVSATSSTSKEEQFLS